MKVKVQAFSTVVLGTKDGKPMVLIYALGADGNIWECAGGHWICLPINSKSTRAISNDIERKVTLEAMRGDE